MHRRRLRFLGVLVALAAIVGLTGCDLVGSASPSSSPSSTPTVDATSVLVALSDACRGGGFVACDVLYVVAAGDQTLRDLGGSCGGGEEPPGWCAALHGVLVDPASMRQECADGDMFSCDALYAYSPLGSDDEQFGWTCGDRARTSPSCITEPGQVPAG